jgi:hypothetical protein
LSKGEKTESLSADGRYVPVKQDTVAKKRTIATILGIAAGFVKQDRTGRLAFSMTGGQTRSLVRRLGSDAADGRTDRNGSGQAKVQ